MSDKRLVILDAACELVATSGLANLTIERVAKQAGLTITEVKKDITDRDMLVRDAFDHADHRSMTLISERLAGRPTFERLEHLLVDYIDDADRAIRQDWIFWMELEAVSLFDDSYDDVLNERADDWQRTIVTLIDVCRGDGSVPDRVDSEAAATRLLLMQDALGRQVILGAIPRDIAAVEMGNAIQRELMTG